MSTVPPPDDRAEQIAWMSMWLRTVPCEDCGAQPYDDCVRAPGDPPFHASRTERFRA